MSDARALTILLAVLAVGCSCEKEPQPEPETPKRKNEPVPIPMTRVTWKRLAFPLPTAWKDNPRGAANGNQILFDGPRGDGEPTVSLLWVESKRPLDNWAAYSRDKYDHPESSAKVLQTGWTTAGGKRAFFMVYALSRDAPATDLADATHITIDWYFRHDGHVGFLRCTCQKGYFAGGYRSLFESIASGLQFLPAPK